LPNLQVPHHSSKGRALFPRSSRTCCYSRWGPASGDKVRIQRITTGRRARSQAEGTEGQGGPARSRSVRRSRRTGEQGPRRDPNLAVKKCHRSDSPLPNTLKREIILVVPRMGGMPVTPAIEATGPERADQGRVQRCLIHRMKELVHSPAMLRTQRRNRRLWPGVHLNLNWP